MKVGKGVYCSSKVSKGSGRGEGGVATYMGLCEDTTSAPVLPATIGQQDVDIGKIGMRA